jgi:hypothetical protein
MLCSQADTFIEGGAGGLSFGAAPELALAAQW